MQHGNGSVVITLVSPTFAGTPGTPNCYGKSISALAQQFGGLPAAAEVLGLTNITALQTVISRFWES